MQYVHERVEEPDITRANPENQHRNTKGGSQQERISPTATPSYGSDELYNLIILGQGHLFYSWVRARLSKQKPVYCKCVCSHLISEEVLMQH